MLRAVRAELEKAGQRLSLIAPRPYLGSPPGLLQSFGPSELSYSGLLVDEAVRMREAGVPPLPALGREAVLAAMNSLGAVDAAAELLYPLYRAGHALLEYLDQLALFDRRSEEFEAADALVGIGQALLEISEDQIAAEARKLIAAGLGARASVLARVGDLASLREALTLLERGQAELDVAGSDDVYRMNALQTQAAVTLQLGDLEQALHVIDRGGAVAGRVDDARAIRLFGQMRAAALAVLANAPPTVRTWPEFELESLVALRGREGAIEDLSRAILAPREDAFDAWTTERQAMVAMLLAGTEGGDAARDALEALLDLRRLRSRQLELSVGSDDWLIARRAMQQEVEKCLASGDVVGAVVAADRARARNLLLELTARPEHLERLEDDVRRVPTEFFGSWSGLAAPPPGDVEGAVAVLRRVSVELKDIVQRILPAGLAPLGRDELLGVVERHGEPVLFLGLIDDLVALLLVTPDGSAVHRWSPVTASTVLSDLAEVQRGLGMRVSTRQGHDAVAAESRRELRLPDVGARKARYVNAASRLYSALIEPLAELLGSCDRCTLCPYRELAALPYAILPDPTGRPLIDRMAITLIPSISTLSKLRLHRDRAPKASRAIIFGDPATPRHLRLELLPGARREARWLRDHLRGAHGPSRVRHYEGTKATPDTYLRHAPGARLVHFSCHGGVGASFRDSLLYLAPGAGGRCVLGADELGVVPLPGAVVFLAACRSGAGRSTAEGTVGLARDFLRAGATAVVASHWSVGDAETATLVEEFYRSFAGTGTSVADSLRGAMLSMRRRLQEGDGDQAAGGSDADSDAVWGPFFVLGDGSVPDLL
ncbi:MAG: CHAT domain-containing protein [Actinobacteria bacterium]|nr:CHAT domain-containing protein [Actinomycetota bacterium]